MTSRSTSCCSTRRQQKQLDEMWRELDFVALGLTRTFIQFFLNESGEARGLRREPKGARPADKEITSEAVVHRAGRGVPQPNPRR